MAHGLFYSVILIGFFASMIIHWIYRAYFDFLITLHTVEVLFLGVVGWYGFGPLVVVPLAMLWLLGIGVIYTMNQFAKVR